MISGILIVYVLIFLGIIGLRILFAVLSYRIGKRKGQELAGLLLGIFLGWIGLIIVQVLPDESARMKQSTYSSQAGPGRALCRHCSREIRADARFCPYCGKHP